VTVNFNEFKILKLVSSIHPKQNSSA